MPSRSLPLNIQHPEFLGHRSGRISALPRHIYRARYPLNTSQKVARPILRLLAEDAHLETKRSYEGKPSRSEWSETSDDSASPLLSGLRRGQHRRTLASECDARSRLQIFLNISQKVTIWLDRDGSPLSSTTDPVDRVFKRFSKASFSICVELRPGSLKSWNRGKTLFTLVRSFRSDDSHHPLLVWHIGSFIQSVISEKSPARSDCAVISWPLIFLTEIFFVPRIFSDLFGPDRATRHILNFWPSATGCPPSLTPRPAESFQLASMPQFRLPSLS
jgi:hypothetical protein